MRVVLAGFGPFPGAPINPSELLVKALARRRRPALAGLTRIVRVFATTYSSVDRDLPKLFAQKPDIVLIFGVAGRRRHVCIETRARNAASPLFPDAAGHRPASTTIRAGGPSALTGTAPFSRLLAAVRANGLPARLSYDAGRYLCNYAYWRALQRASRGYPVVQFIHIPSVRLNHRARSRIVHRSPSLAELTRGAENLLIALMAASRR
jgi:pyroglutamyl-peptidase